MPRTEYNDAEAERNFQKGIKKLKEDMPSFNSNERQGEDESMLDYDRRRSGMDEFRSGNYKKNSRGGYDYKPFNPR